MVSLNTLQQSSEKVPLIKVPISEWPKLQSNLALACVQQRGVSIWLWNWSAFSSVEDVHLVFLAILKDALDNKAIAGLQDFSHLYHVHEHGGYHVPEHRGTAHICW